MGNPNRKSVTKKNRLWNLMVIIRAILKCGVVTSCLLLNTPHHSVAIRVDGSILPVAPMKNGCRIVFNEVDLFDQGGKQFIELTRICEASPFQSTNKIDMGNYKIIFVSHKGFIVAVCNLRGSVEVKDDWYFTVGTAGIPNINLDLSICEFSTVQVPGAASRLPQGVEFPVALILLRNEKKSVLQNVKLIDVGGVYRSTKVDAKMEKTIIRNIQDYYLIGSKTPFIFCEYFRRFYYLYEPSGFFSALIRDLAGSAGSNRKSLSRCATKSDEAFSSPMQPQIMKYATPTPSTANDCETSFVLPANLHKRPRVVSDGCYSVYGTINQQREFFRNPNIFQLDMDLAELNPDPEVITEDMEMDQNEFEAILQQDVPHQWTDCTRFPEHQLIAMQNLPFSPIPISSVVNPKTCSWLEFLLNSQKLRCKQCTALVNQGIIQDRPGSRQTAGMVRTGAGWATVVDSDQGVRARSYNKKLIEDHEASVIHKMTEDYMRLVDLGKSEQELKSEFERVGGPFRKYIESTENLIKAVIYSVQMNLSFRSFKILGEMLQSFGVDTGFLYNTEQSMSMLSKCVSRSLHNDFINHLRSNPRELSIILDGSTDCSGYSTIAVLFQTYGPDNKINVFLYRVMEVKTSEGGQDIFDLFESYLREDGLLEVVKQKTVALGTDGASNVRGTFREKLNDFTDNELIGVWCFCHKLEIVAKRAYTKFDYLLFVDKFINRMCRFLTKKSGKRNLVFRQVIKEMGFNRFELKRIRTMRWVGHRYRAVVPIINRYEVLIETFSRIASDNSYRSEVRQEARYLLNELKDATLLSTICFTADVVNELAKYSGLLQTKGTTLIGKHALRKEMKENIEALLETPGKNVRYLTDNAVIMTEDGDEDVVSYDDFLESQIKFKNIELNQPDCNAWVCVRNTSQHYINAIVTELDEYFPPSVTDLFDIFLPTNIPQTHELILTYAEDDMKELNTRLKWGFQEEELLEEWHELVESIVDHEKFDEQVHNTPEDFWNFFLAAAGIQWTDKMRTVLNRILTTPPTSSSPESIFSMYSFIKDRKRYNLLPDSVESLIRIRYNGYKDVSKYDTVSIVREFLKSHSRSDDSSRRKKAGTDGNENDAADGLCDEIDKTTDDVNDLLDADFDEDEEYFDDDDEDETEFGTAPDEVNNDHSSELASQEDDDINQTENDDDEEETVQDD